MNSPAFKSYFSASELANMRLPNLPGTERGIRITAERNKWDARKKLQGKGFEYAISSLPIDAVRAIQARAAAAGRVDQLMDPAAAPVINSRIPGSQMSLLDDENRREADRQVLLRLPKLTPKQVARFEARRSLTLAWYTYLKLHGMRPSRKLYEAFVSHFNAGHLQANKVQYPELAIATAGVIEQIALRTLQMWVSDYEKTGLAAFVDKLDGSHQRGRCQISLQPDLHNFTLGMLVSNPHIKPVHLEQAAAARFAGHSNVSVPGYHAFRRFINQWKTDNAELFTALINPDAWKNQHMAAFGSASEDVFGLNQRWEFDSTPADLMLTDGRYCLLGVIDVWSRRAKLLVAKTSRALGVGVLVRAALLDWGKCAEAKTDNGQEYVGVYVDDVFRALDIEQIKCPPFQPWHKPHIERLFRTFSHDLLELLPGYIGHNVAERKAIEARKQFSERLFTKNEVLNVGMSSQQLQAFCDQWLVRYHNAPHSQLEMSPFAKAATWTGEVEQIDNPRLLDVLLAERIDRTVLKKGLQIDGGWFIAPELAVNLIGRQVQVRLDPTDLGRVYVFHDGQFICVAECPERTGMDRQRVAQQAKQLQTAEVSRQKRELKALARRVNTDEVVQEILRADAERAGKLVSLPRPAAAVDTQGTRAAAAAVQAVDNPQSNIPLAIQRQQALAAKSAPAPVDIPLSDEAKFRRWLELSDLVEHGQAIPENEQRFFAGFPKTARFMVQHEKHQKLQASQPRNAGNH